MLGWNLMKKRIFGILISIVLIITAIPLAMVNISAVDDDGVLRIGGTLVEDGQYYIDGGTPTEKPESRTENYAYFKDGVLELHSLKLDKRVSALISVADMDITILLVGNNSLSGVNGETKAISSNSDLEIVGHGKLEIYRCVTGIESTDGRITIVDAELDIKSDHDALFGSRGISTTAAKINAKMGSDVTKSAIRTDKGEIRFYASDIVVNATGYGVRCNESSNQSLFIHGGSFKATSTGSCAVI